MLDKSIVYLIHCIIENEMQDTGNSIFDAQLSTVQYKDISAVVKKVDAEIARELEVHEEQLRSMLAAYQQTNIDIFRHCNMLPLRFGLMVDHKEEVKHFLSTSYIHLKWALDRLQGKAEFAVHLSWDLDAVLQEIGRDKEWLGEARESIKLADKVEIGRLLFKAADAKKKEIVGSIHSKLSETALDSSAGRSADESIIMNRSYLIEKTAEESFDNAMMELAQSSESYLSIKYVGPIPPYSFAPLEFKLGNFDLIDEARRRLSLPEHAGFGDVKSSYRRLSLENHPDKSPGDDYASERFRQIDEAYRILEAYCYSCDGALISRGKGEYSFTQDSVEEIFMVERALAR